MAAKFKVYVNDDNDDNDATLAWITSTCGNHLNNVTYYSM